MNINEISQAIILSKMGLDAQSVSFKTNALGDIKLSGDEMLSYYKVPFAVFCNKSYLILSR